MAVGKGQAVKEQKAPQKNCRGTRQIFFPIQTQNKYKKYKKKEGGDKNRKDERRARLNLRKNDLCPSVCISG
ncbi:MAG: hypothetical protein CR997_00840 [Acidobacteria bacterium]|nr:MAG: hypothetical protein CR997_00840 [Acidobacteriota bacterium]